MRLVYQALFLPTTQSNTFTANNCIVTMRHVQYVFVKCASMHDCAVPFAVAAQVLGSATDNLLNTGILQPRTLATVRYAFRRNLNVPTFTRKLSKDGLEKRRLA